MRPLLIALLVCSCSQNSDKPPPSQQRIVVETPAPAKPGVSQRLFADRVATLPLTIGIETIGGFSSIMIPRGTKLPISHTEVFSTALDNQASVEVHIVQGERLMAGDNRSLGKFVLGGIPPAPRGIPQIEVVFSIIDDGVLEVSARDKATGATREIRIDGAATALDKAAVDKLLADALAARPIDEKRRAFTDAHMKLTNLVMEANRLLATVDNKLSPATRKRWTDEIARAQVLLAASGPQHAATPADPAPLLKATEAMQNTMHTGAVELYRDAK